MSNEAKLYWLTRLDSIQGIFIALLMVSFIGIGAYFIVGTTQWDVEFSEFNKKYKSLRKWLITSVVISGLFLAFIPSKNEMILIYAGGKTMDFIQADTSINKLPAKSTELIFKYLDEKVKEMDKKK